MSISSEELGLVAFAWFSKPYGYAHLKKMEKEGDVGGLIAAFDERRVERSPNLRGAVVTSLRRIGDRRAVPAIGVLLLSDPAESVRCQAAKALGELEDDTALPSLRAALDDESDKVRMWATCSLGKLRDRDSVGRLVELLGDADWGLRGYAASALGEIGDQRAIGALLPMLEDSSSTVRAAAEQALGELRLTLKTPHD
jgi:HEAT repeat protein